jgi:aryl-alcohol dehydrogenase-like predicted oxidoreductase
MSAMTITPSDHASDAPAAAAGSLALGAGPVVRRMGFGARWVTDAGPEGSRALLHRALELGVNLIDTADVYGGGYSEEFIAEALHPYPEGLVIATKGGQVSRDGLPAPDGRPEYLRAACEESRRRLRLDSIPLYQLHNPDPDVPIEESMGALAELQAEGKIQQIGVSNMFAELLEQALATAPVVSVQNRYNVVQRFSDAAIDRCAAEGVAFMPWQPLNGTDQEALRAVADERGTEPAQIALAWLLARSPAMLVIPGTKSIEHLERNVAAAALELSAAELAQLDSLATPA